MQITLVAATLLLLGVASAKATDLENGMMLSLTELKENKPVTVQCHPRGDVTIDADADVIKHSKSCFVEKIPIAPFDRSDDQWEFERIKLGQNPTKPLQLYGIKSAVILPNFPYHVFIAYN